MHLSLDKKIFLTPVLVALCWSCAPTAHAAQIHFIVTPASPSAGSTFTVEAWLSTQNDRINAAEGSVAIPDGLTVRSVSTGGSGFTLWPVEPHFAPGDHAIEFAGGVQAGIASGQETPLFTFSVTTSAPGKYLISASHVNAYRADGTGAEIAVTGVPKDVALEIIESVPTIPENDSNVPTFVSVEVGQDPSLFNGRQYLTFFATDDKSGVSYYEVKEGWFGQYVKADRYYVLADQGRGSPIWVRVVDAEGNSTVEKIPSQHTDYTFLYNVGGILVVMLLAIFTWYVRRRR
ncbi:MAG: hypothetical protein NTY93_01300 [Candidatus Kaiserbacteria bacterium]|nr:hypothetical protein [Candidatus Kaiserbacteria bacterium]